MGAIVSYAFFVFIFVMVALKRKKKQEEQMNQNKKDQHKQEHVPLTNGKHHSNDDLNCGHTPGSTTEYLHDKARRDEEEHRKEAAVERQILHKKSGGRIPAIRLYEGDMVPAGYFCVKCSYCAAENLIAHGSNVQKYSCYFCREPL